MTGSIVVLGYGAIGRPVAQALAARGDAVRIAQRNRPPRLPDGAQFRPCDVLDLPSLRRAIEGADQVVVTVGFAYDARVWRRAWPAAMANIVEACAETGARIVFLDNLYQLGPKDEPYREDMPLTPRGRKSAILAEVAGIWQDAAAAGRIRLAALRCPDFYGPGVPNSHLGEVAFGAMAKGEPALLIGGADMPHDFAYAPDITRALLALVDAPDDAFNQVWNMPCPPTRSRREILQLGAEALGVKLRLRSLPLALLPALGLAFPMMREVADVSFNWDRPYRVDGSRFTRRFGFAVTPFEVSAPTTARAFRAQAAPARGVSGQALAAQA